MFAPRPRLFALLLALAALGHSAAVAQVALALPATAESVAAIKSEKGAVATLVTEGGSPALKVEFPAGSGYPGVNFPLGGPVLDLSAHAGVEIELTNTGPERLNLNVRVDNAGDWKLSPWNTESGNVEPGQTRVFRVRFGRSHGQAAYALDPKAISAIKLLPPTPRSPPPWS